MLSNPPNSGSKGSKGEGKAPSQGRLSDEEEMDQEIGTAVLVDTFLGGEGEQGISRALNSPEPAKALAIQIFSVIEATQTESMDTEMPLSPRMWLAQGGAVDDFMEDLSEFGPRFGADSATIEGLAPSVKQELVTMFQARSKDLAGQAAQQGGGGMGGPPQAGPPAPMPPQQQPGGM